ncbi:beta-carotene 15,15'-monooxygenase [Streptococcus australis]|uniref:beta-carotene 15,15'-monooxygenase n=1 Tax=Streptococcus australis TaxID=113107 RepID=UPI00232C5BB3|nr:beta-carotene 15,15'-monooxygenase [Streptococcus australis]MDB8642739.1 beta-carotene 15,15'-monooxygenase [Streptococcus australis]MDB8645907.1 beta-carotene 15,15'-monooxygenase [Streptococcus australis]
MKRISIFDADFERSKKIVTNGKFVLTAGMPNPIHMGIINRLFTVLFCIFIFFGIMVYFLLIALPSSVGQSGEVHYLSHQSVSLFQTIGEIMRPISIVFYLIFLFGSIPVFWPKKRLSSQIWTYFPFYFSMSVCAFISGFYFASAVTYDAYTVVGFWFQLVLGIVLFFWIITNSIQNLKRRLNDEEEKSILKKVMMITVGTMVVFFPVSLVYHLMNQLPVLWYFYIFGLFLVVWFVIAGYYFSHMINIHIVQAYYIRKYPMEYKEYLGISDREWYSKSYYKKLVKSGQLVENK